MADPKPTTIHPSKLRDVARREGVLSQMRDTGAILYRMGYDPERDLTYREIRDQNLPLTQLEELVFKMESIERLDLCPLSCNGVIIARIPRIPLRDWVKAQDGSPPSPRWLRPQPGEPPLPISQDKPQTSPAPRPGSQAALLDQIIRRSIEAERKASMFSKLYSGQDVSFGDHATFTVVTQTPDGRIHFDAESVRFTGTVTGRMSSSDPAQANAPRKTRPVGRRAEIIVVDDPLTAPSEILSDLRWIPS